MKQDQVVSGKAGPQKSPGNSRQQETGITEYEELRCLSIQNMTVGVSG